MKELSKTQFAIFAMGGILMAVGAGCMALGFMVPKLVGVTSWLFLLGTVLFSVTQATQVYEGNNLTTILRRPLLHSLGHLHGGHGAWPFHRPF